MERRELARLWMLTGTAADRLRARVKSTRSLTVAIDEADELVKLLDRCTAALHEYHTEVSATTRKDVA